MITLATNKFKNSNAQVKLRWTRSRNLPCIVKETKTELIIKAPMGHDKEVFSFIKENYQKLGICSISIYLTMRDSISYSLAKETFQDLVDLEVYIHNN
jgi:hypothetical protein